MTIEVTTSIIRGAARLAEVHRLRAYDAVHLASAATIQNQIAESFVFASWDRTLERAARLERLEPLPR
jgi:hypothetical protein